MSRRGILRVLAGWALVTALGAMFVHCQTRIDPGPMPDAEASQWALGALEAVGAGESPPPAPASAEAFDADGPVFVIAWVRGLPLVRHVGTENLAETIAAAGQAFAEDPELLAQPGWGRPGAEGERVRFTIEVTRGEAPLWVGVPFIENLGVVPLREGLHLSLDGEDAYLTPEQLRAADVYDVGVVTPIPDLTIGVDIASLVGQLARNLGREESAAADGSVRRLWASPVVAEHYPIRVEVTEEALREAVVEGAEFLLRHMLPDGRYTYLYDARTGEGRFAGYNLPRHSGTTYFLAQVAALQGMPAAREGARRALAWVYDTRIRHCGGPALWCVEQGGAVEMGSSALTALAAAEFLKSGDDPMVRELLDNVTAHIRDMQRDDGELMHLYDLEADEPIDEQLMYYSGEAALALLSAHEVTNNPLDLEAARRLMAHLTGAGWDFLGSRYYFGEEHWTCIAAGAASDRIESPEAVDFCRRWAEFSRHVQYGEGETPWDSVGAYGVGPIIVPRLTPVASRSEAYISTYIAARRGGIEDRALRDQIEAGLGMLLAYRWAPGPAHLMADPIGARGGIPATSVDLTVRNDFVQHACSAMIRWADVLRLEREGASNP